MNTPQSFKNLVYSKLDASSAEFTERECYGQSNSLKFNKGNLQLGIPNLESYAQSSAPLILYSGIELSPNSTLFIAVHFAQNMTAIQSRLSEMLERQDLGYADKNNNCGAILTANGKVFFHNNIKTAKIEDLAEDSGIYPDNIFSVIIGSDVLSSESFLNNIKKFIDSDHTNFLNFTDGSRVSSGSSKPNFYLDHNNISILSKSFLILTGLSGSGKSRAASQIAKSFSTGTSHYHFAAVGPDWNNRDPLLGYPDGIQPEVYQTTPVLELLIKASLTGNENKPHFLILDEMNLSHVERYFADFLSAMESGEEITLYEGEQRKKMEKTISIPPNFFIIGTVNIDETTYQFSPKVLDRANVIEFRMEEGAVGKFFDGSTDEMEAGAMAGIAEQFVNDAKTRDEVAVEWAGGREGFREEMEALFQILRNFNAEFGYRTLKESSRYLYFHDKYSDIGDDAAKYQDAMDHIIIQKLLPKLHGSRSKLEGVLRALLHFCEAGDRNMTALQASSLKAAEATDTALDMLGKRDGVEIKGHYKLSHDKLRRMCRKLHQDQFVSFADA